MVVSGVTKKITLQAWAERNYDPPPSRRTLRTMVREGRISPAPELVGREYRVSEDAVVLPPKRPLRLAPVTVLQSVDPVVNDIINSGKTSQRRQA